MRLDDETIENVAMQAGPFSGDYLEERIRRLYWEFWHMPNPDKGVLLRMLMDRCDTELPRQELIDACVAATVCQYLLTARVDIRA